MCIRDSTQPVQVVERIVERLQLRLAAVAGAGIDMTHMQTAAKDPVNLSFERLPVVGGSGVDPNEILATACSKGPIARGGEGVGRADLHTHLALSLIHI